MFRNQWQYRPNPGEADADFKDRIRPILREQLSSAKANGFLVPQLVYGYFCVNGDGDDLVVWTDETRTVERTRFHYPRQKVAPYMCIADFFRPVESGEADYAAFHIVTMGQPVSEKAAELFAANRYQEYLELHGIGVISLKFKQARKYAGLNLEGAETPDRHKITFDASPKFAELVGDALGTPVY